ncbi:CMP-N-acetylneuraminate-beta-galactosamide-alpha-2,3-sialyltransferase 4-like [Saccoglossus kowalevskii]
MALNHKKMFILIMLIIIPLMAFTMYFTDSKNIQWLKANNESKFLNSRNINLTQVLEEKVTGPTMKTRSIETTANMTRVSPTLIPCTKGYTHRAIKRLVPTFDPDLPLFLNRDFRKWKDFDRLKETTEPYGFKYHVSFVEKLMQALPGNTPNIMGNDMKCRRCVIIASSGGSIGKHLGSLIDRYDVVIRMNDAPVRNYERDVGSITAFRMLYPESATAKRIDISDAYIVFLPYKLSDYQWLYDVIKGKNPLKRIGAHFWKSVPKMFDKNVNKIRILNPYIHEEAKVYHLKNNMCIYDSNYHHRSRLNKQFRHHHHYHHSRCQLMNRPSCGIVGIVMALHYCDHVDITGFSAYDDDPNIPIHYYDPELKKPRNTVHDWTSEQRYLNKLLKCGVIERDLTTTDRTNITYDPELCQS